VAKKPAVSIYIRIRTADGKQRYCPAIWESRHKKLKMGWCNVKGVPEFHPGSSYHLRYSLNGVPKWESVEGDGTYVLDLRATRREQLAHPRAHQKFITNGARKPKTERGEPRTERYRLDSEIKTYLSNAEKLSAKTYKAYRFSLTLFLQSCDKTYVELIKKQDLQLFDNLLIKRGNEDRTRSNRVGHVVTFLRNIEGRRAGPPVKDVSITVKYVEMPPEAYTRQELVDLFRVSSDDERLLWRFLLGTGFREDEVSVSEHSDLNRERKLATVLEKPYFAFKPKDCEKRSVPIPDDLIALLSAKTDGRGLIFGKNGKPDGHLLRRLKTVAWQGGLNCRRCMGTISGRPISCAVGAVCEKWILHRFRKNFATDRHQKGASARQIQKWLGHSNLETTLRYLATMEDTSELVRDICNEAHAGL
jgi:integrase/recombinase XerD